MPGWGKVAIGVRVTHPEPRFFQSWTRLVTRGLRPGDVVLTPVVDLPHHYAADAVALHFLRSDADSVLFIDDDMTFTTDSLSRLRDFQPGHQFDVLQAVALSRNGPHLPVVLFKGATQYEIMPRPPGHTVIPVALCGLAFTLIRRAVFERIAAKKDPKDFFFYWGRRGDSEDAGFSTDAAATGSTLGVCTDVAVGHLVTCQVDYDLEKLGVNVTSTNNGVQRLIGEGRDKW